MDLHELVLKLKEFAAETGKIPTRAEFCAAFPGAGYAIAKFGTYSSLCRAAGFPAYDERRNKNGKLNQNLFQRDIPTVLAEHQPLENTAPILASGPITSTLVIGDTHFPWVNERVLKVIYEFAEKHQPGRIIQIGDLYDMYAHSKFPRSLNVYMPEEEERLARAGAAEMWLKLRDLCPNAKCVQLKGNHDIRPLRRTLENQPAIEHVVAAHLDKLMTFEGVELIKDPRQEYIVDGIEFIHGYKSKLGDHRDYALMSAVCGHVHTGGVVFRRIRGQTLFELNAGLVGDPESKVFGYTPQKITNWTPGFGFIDQYGPRFISC